MKDKILNFLIIFFLTILLVNIFFKDNSQNSNGTLTFNLEKKSYTIPASPVIVVSNNTQTDVKINTCKDININFSGEKLSFPNDFCKDIEIKANTKEKINYNKYYDKFGNIGVYNFIIKYDNKEYITQTEIKNKGLISKIFVGLIYAPLYNLTIFFVEFFNNSLGWAIITITLIIRLFLLYPQHKMMVSQRKLNAIQPKIKALQEKFKGNSQMLGVEMMKLYKDENINPFGSCGLLLIQMPILLVIYRIFINIKDYSNTYYLYNGLSNFNLDGIGHYFFGIDLLGVGGITGICLGIFIAVIQFLQVKLSLVKNNTNKPVMLEKKKDAKDYQSLMPDQDVLNKFMLYGLPGMVGVFTYSLLAGVGVYWGISTTFTIIQQLIVNKKTEK
ncbi:MAG: YidC/Oxa1 family membrane protein insertase [Candidatus Gracilibacteria bacterium]|nr:YidC/Oxa1 family membrane protein insertase [Candidatus Gracilibacteria bacterium]